MSLTRVVLRADAGASIGGGHLMRCVALARALPPHVQPVIATTCEHGSLLAHAERAGIRVVVLDAPEPGARDAAQVCRLLEGEGAWIVVDG